MSKLLGFVEFSMMVIDFETFISYSFVVSDKKCMFVVFCSTGDDRTGPQNLKAI
jgi:hypothetical protein